MHIVTACRAGAPSASTWAVRSCSPARSILGSRSITAPSAAINRLDVSYLLDVVVDAVEETVAGAGGEVAAVGFGIPSLIDQRTGNAVIAVNLPLKNIMFADVMAERLDLPVFVDNDANCAMLAEHRAGAARGCNEAVLLTIGTGIGGGLILRGELYRGAVGAAAELGHVVIERDGPPCQGNCPNHGCVESLASGTALAREALRMAHERPDSGLGRAHAEGRELVGPLVTELAHDGDEAAIETIATIGRNLGVAIAGLRQHVQPRGRRDRRRRDRRRRAPARPASGPRSPSGRCRPRATWSRSCRRRSASRRG